MNQIVAKSLQNFDKTGRGIVSAHEVRHVLRAMSEEFGVTDEVIDFFMQVKVLPWVFSLLFSMRFLNVHLMHYM